MGLDQDRQAAASPVPAGWADAEEALRLLGTVRKLRYRVVFTTLYSNRLRLSEGGLAHL